MIAVALLLIAGLVIILSSAGCVGNLGVIRPIFPTSGGPKAMLWGAESFDSPGAVMVALPDDIVLTGEWVEVGSTTALGDVAVSTSVGVVTSADLAYPERPGTIAKLAAQGQELEMICVCVRETEDDYEVTCADSEGRRWTDHAGGLEDIQRIELLPFPSRGVEDVPFPLQ